MRAVEKFYSVSETALLLSLCEKTVLQKLKAREFGAAVANVGSDKRPDYRIPASGINAWLDRRRVFFESDPGIAARSVGELRRKVETVEQIGSA